MKNIEFDVKLTKNVFRYKPSILRRADFKFYKIRFVFKGYDTI